MSWRYSAIALLSAGLALTQVGKALSTPPDQAKDRSQDAGTKPASSGGQLPPSDAPPRSDAAGDPAESLPTLPSAAPSDGSFSSSRENILDLSAPKDDLKDHPGSAAAIAREEEEDNAAVQEFHQWNPMKALKDVEIGDYYFKRKNYVAAMDRYKGALFYKENDAVATFRLAVSEEKLGDKASALTNYTGYLKILPHGPFADEARSSIERLGGVAPEKDAPEKKETASQQPAPEKP